MKNIVRVARQIDVLRDIVLDEAKTIIAGEMLNIGDVARHQIIQTNDVMPLGQQKVAEMRPQKSGATRNQYSHSFWSSATV